MTSVLENRKSLTIDLKWEKIKNKKNKVGQERCV